MHDDEGLECRPELLLQAFELVGDYVNKGRSHKARFEERWELALCLVDRALMECDRGKKYLELTAEMALKPRSGDGFIYIAP